MTVKEYSSKLVLILLLLSIQIPGYTQAPQGFSYQAVVRDGNGVPITNRNVTIKITLQNFAQTPLYIEKKSIQTSAQGIVNHTIGLIANKIFGDFANIPWSSGDVYVKVDVDPNGGDNFTLVGEPSKLQSVPYALYANPKEIISDSNANPDDPIFEVKNKDGKVVFGVYQGGVRVYVEDTPIKGAKGGFAVGGLSGSSKGAATFLSITPDSARIYLKQTKGAKGGFAVGGLSGSSKASTGNFLDLTPENYFIGHNSGTKTSGLYNSFIGYESGSINITGANNVFLGYHSGFNNDASNNTFIGYQSGNNNTVGQFNSFMGYNTGFSNTIGSYNCFWGTETGFSNQTGSSNIFVGNKAGYTSTEGSNNIFLGYKTGFSNAGNYNIMMGNESGYANTIGEYNVFVGFQSGNQNLSGSNNTFIGYQSGYKNTSGSNNAFIGNLSGYNNKTGSRNTYLGNKAGYSYWNGASGNRNVFIGDSTGYTNASGYDNVFLGSQVGPQNTDGHSNVFLGYRSGYSNQGGYSNVFIGKEAGYNAFLGYDNVYIGYRTGYAGHGQYNVYIGHEAGLNNAGGSLNTFIGKSAGRSHTDGDYNVFLGLESGFSNITGERNVFLGYSAGSQETGSDRLYIANSSTTTPLIWGDFYYNRVGINMQATTNALEVEGNASKTTATAWLANSDRRIKTDIKDISDAFETVLKLRPVKFKYTNDYIKKHPSIENKYYYNFIAQEFQQVFPEAVKGSGEYLNGDSNEILQIDTYNAQIVTIKAVQELILENKKQKTEIDNLKAEIEAIKTMLKK